MDNRSGVKYMAMALRLAARGRDRTYPNPMVGAVIIKDGKVIGRGYHRRAGEDHAEIRAIKDVSGSLRGAEMFVTLEPCAHYGRTPPCVPAIVKSGIRKLNAAMPDPNPITGGRGIKALRQAGISVKVGLCGDEARRLNRKYIKYVTAGLPYVTVKLAQSLDGKIAARDGSSKWITSAYSRERAGRMRSGFDAVIVGVNTVCRDDPFLLGRGTRGNGPRRVVVDSSLRMPFASNLIRTADKAPVIIVTTERASGPRVKKFSAVKGVEILTVRSRNKRVSLRPFLRKLARENIVNALVEGGGELVGSLKDESLVDEWMFFIAPKILGGGHSSVKGKGAANIRKAMELCDMEFKKSGRDIIITGKTAGSVFWNGGMPCSPV